MRATISFKVSAAEREHLQRLVADRNTPAKVAWRAKIILGSADGLGTMAIMRATGKSKPCVWRWQERFAMEGVDGLVRDKTRPPGRAPLSAAVKRKVLAKTANETPPDATHWSVRTMAKAVGISRTSVQRIWAEAGLKPHLVKRFKISNDPAFEEKVTDVVGLYMNPPDRALVLCVDEKSQIQALERTQPVLPMGLGYIERVTHDYHRHGTTTLFAALDTRDGKVITLCKPRHRQQEFLAFLNHLDRSVPTGVDIHLIADNYGTHKHPKVKTWLARRPRYHLHYTPTYASWLNQVERWFGLITQQAIRRGSFRSVGELVQKIDTYVASYNLHRRPFVWTASADSILVKLQRLCKLINGT
jgi:transposase